MVKLLKIALFQQCGFALQAILIQSRRTLDSRRVELLVSQGYRWIHVHCPTRW